MGRWINGQLKAVKEIKKREEKEEMHAGRCVWSCEHFYFAMSLTADYYPVTLKFKLQASQCLLVEKVTSLSMSKSQVKSCQAWGLICNTVMKYTCTHSIEAKILVMRLDVPFHHHHFFFIHTVHPHMHPAVHRGHLFKSVLLLSTASQVGRWFSRFCSFDVPRGIQNRQLPYV